METLRNFIKKLLLFSILFDIVVAKAVWYTAGDGTKYLIEGERQFNWFQAYDQCARLGLQLVVIDNASKNNYVSAILQSITTVPCDDVWIGLHDEFNTKIDTNRPFYAISTGQRVAFSKWLIDEPNNTDGTEHCVEIRKRSIIGWNDDTCSILYGYICEEPHHTTQYRRDMTDRRQQVYKKNTQVSSKFDGVNKNVRQVIESTRIETDDILEEFKQSTDEIVADLKMSIKEIVLQKPYMKPVMDDLNNSIQPIVFEKEQELAKLSDEVRQTIKTKHLNAESSTSTVNDNFSQVLTRNTKDVDELLVY